MSLSGPDFYDLVLEESSKLNITPPKSFTEDFFRVFGLLGEISNQSQFENKVCAPLKQSLKENLHITENYEQIFKALRDEVRKKTAIILGFETLVLERSRKGVSSIHDTLMDFLMSLRESQSWSVRNLKEWKENSEDRGKKLYHRVYRSVPWDLDTIKIMLADRAEEMLERNPFKPELSKNIKSIYHARKYFKEFFKTLTKGQEWTHSDLVAWEGNDVSGETLRIWVQNNTASGDLSEEALEEIMGQGYHYYRKNYPFDSHWRISSLEKAKKHLLVFLAELEEGDIWSPSMISVWEKSRKGSLLCWIRRNLLTEDDSEINEDIIRELLGDDANHLLERNPYSCRERKIKTTKDARKYLREFLSTLEPGESWTLAMIENSDISVRGTTLVHWIRQRMRDKKTNSMCWNIALKKLITEEELDINPYEVGTRR